MPIPQLQPINPFAGFLEGRQARRQEGVADQQNALLQLQLSEAQRQGQEREGLNKLYQTAMTPEGGIDYAKLLPGAAQAGLGSAIPGLVKQKAETDKLQREADKARIEGTLQRFDFVGRALSSARDEPSWRQATALIAQEYPDMQLPPNFDPAAIEAARLQAMPIKDQLEQEWKQKGYDLDQDKFSYQQQNDAANRGVTLRGQNMADARAREGTRKGQYDAERGVIVDPVTGVARPVTLADGGALPPKKSGGAPTEDERKTAYNLQRLQNAERVLADPAVASAQKPELLPEALRYLPLVPEAAANATTSGSRQQVESAQLDALDAALTIATGAAYTREQLKGLAKSYYPQIGDKPDALADKARRRQEIIEAAKLRADRAMPQVAPPAAGSFKYLGAE